MQDPKSKEERPDAAPGRALEHWESDEREANGARRFLLVGDEWKPRTPKPPAGE